MSWSVLFFLCEFYVIPQNIYYIELCQNCLCIDIAKYSTKTSQWAGTLPSSKMITIYMLMSRNKFHFSFFCFNNVFHSKLY